MKRYVGLALIIFSLTAGTAFAACLGGIGSSCGYGPSCPDQICSTCECADLGAGLNDCISLRDYCDAFGNIGSR